YRHAACFNNTRKHFIFNSENFCCSSIFDLLVEILALLFKLLDVLIKRFVLIGNLRPRSRMLAFKNSNDSINLTLNFCYSVYVLWHRASLSNWLELFEELKHVLE